MDKLRRKGLYLSKGLNKIEQVQRQEYFEAHQGVLLPELFCTLMQGLLFSCGVKHQESGSDIC